MGRLIGICEACGYNNEVQPNQRFFRCSACNVTNDICAPDKTIRIENITDVSKRNEAAMILFNAGNYSAAYNEWFQVTKVSPADGTANFGLCLCEYTNKHRSLLGCTANSNNTQLFIEDIRAGFKSYDGIDEHNIPDLTIAKDSAHYILAAKYAPQAEFNQFDRNVTIHNNEARQFMNIAFNEYQKWGNERKRGQEAYLAERERRNARGLCPLCGGKGRKDTRTAVEGWRTCKKCGNSYFLYSIK